MTSNARAAPGVPTPLPAASPTRDLVLTAALGLAVFMVYLPALQGGFIWNDSDYVTAPHLRSLAGLWRIWFEVGATEQFYPLLHSAFWLEHMLWGDAAAGYHAVNIAQHAANAGLLVLLLRRLNLRGAWAAGFLFALHPVCVESVAWIAEQKNTLSTLFYLLAALAYLRFDRTRRGRDYAVASAWFVAALLTKSVTATLVGALPVVLWWQRGRLEWKRDLQPLLPWTVAGAAAGLFTGWVERTILGAQGADFSLNLLERTLLAGRTTWFYLGKLAWPADLIFIYPRWRIDAADWTQYLYPALLLAVLAAVWLLRRRSRAPLAVLLLFLGLLFPTSGFFNVYGFLFSYVADHWQYLPSLAVFSLAGEGLAGLTDAFPVRLRAGGALPTLVVAGLLGLLSWRQSGLYREIVTFYERTLAANPRSWMALNNLGNVYADRHDWAKAADFYSRGLAIKEERFELHNNLGLALLHLSRWPEAAQHFDRAACLNPRSFVSHYNLGNLLRLGGQLDQAETSLRAALAVRPDYPEARHALALTLRQLGRRDDALREIGEALHRNPDDTEALNVAGLILTDLGRLPEAEQDFHRALVLRPDFAGAHDNLGNTFRKAGRVADAVREYEAALVLSPQSAVTLVNLTLALTDLGRFAEAAARGEQAVALAPGLAEAHFNLALARRGEGKLDAARTSYQNARRLKPTLPLVPDLEPSS